MKEEKDNIKIIKNMSNNMNPFLCTDGYKVSHNRMYPQGTTLVYSNFTPRHGKHTNVKGGKGVISFGQQMVMRQIKEMFTDYFFGESKNFVIEEIKKEYSMYLGEDYDVSHIEDLWDLGYLPIKVKALPEGTFVPYGVPVLTIVNTKPEFFWLTNFLETLISNMLWMPMTSATTAHHYKQILAEACKNTDENSKEFVDFQGHNFGMRGMAGLDATLYAGLGHATSFKGDDSLPTIHAARKYYDEKGFVVGSVNATEHSVMCAGEKDDELGTFRYLMSQFPTGILSIVSDTWDLWKVLTEYLPTLKEEILARDGKLVIRPDSGDPVDIICGTLNYPDKESFELDYGDPMLNKTVQEKGVIELLWDIFGGSINDQGYKVLDPHIGAIYGDSITPERAKQICKRLEAKGFASTNIVLGIGSFTYQYVTRDTHGFAMKATYVEVQQTYTDVEVKSSLNEMGYKYFDTEDFSEDAINEGFKFNEKTNLWTFDEDIVEGREIFKDPITDDGTKKSAKGLLTVGLNHHDKSYYLKDQIDWSHESKGELNIIFEDGKFSNEVTLTETRERVNKLI